MSNDSFRKGLEGLDSGPAGSPRETPRVEAPEGGIPAHPTVDALRIQFGEAIGLHELVAGDEHVVYIDPARAFQILHWLRDEPGQQYDFLQDLTAVDYGNGTTIQVVWQLWSIPNRLNIRIKADLPLDALEVDSVYYVWRAADWLEREVWDLFGVTFRGHPDLRRILMPYNYTEGHPLRKDFPLRGRYSRAEQTQRALSMTIEDHYSAIELAVARRIGQDLPEVIVEGGTGLTDSVGMGSGAGDI
ncbi:MAG: NADH-quinone oxidoreductase subunit C [Gemmatimonadota bacterium]|jgi:NADH-quinone oxidoreductase subunit C|nr:NADH-quinone oxidoreductase subunit C [Gemmatimonadota bacterium]